MRRKLLFAGTVAAALAAVPAAAQSVKIGVDTYLAGRAASPWGVPATNAA